jgi:hypothetical protein
MNNEKESTYILCIRKADSKWSIVAEGSTLTNCIDCDQQVWISPASVDVMLERQCKPLCLYCALEKKPDRAILPPSTGQLKEIIKELKKELEIENPTNRFKNKGSR